MFKWTCLIFAFLAVAGLGWMVYDVGCDLKQTARTTREFGADFKAMSQTTREVGDEITRSSKTINKDLPDIVENMRASTEALAKLTEELNQFRKLAGGAVRPADEGLPAYANGLLEFIQKSGGKVGLKSPLGKGLAFEQAADKWVEFIRPQALALVFIAKNRSDYLNALAGTFYIQVGDEQPRSLKEWIRANHLPSKELK